MNQDKRLITNIRYSYGFNENNLHVKWRSSGNNRRVFREGEESFKFTNDEKGKQLFEEALSYYRKAHVELLPID